MKSSIFLLAAASLALCALMPGPARASLICTGSVIDDTGSPCDGSAVGLRIGREAAGSMSVTGGSTMVVIPSDASDTPDDELAFVHVGRTFDGTLAVSGGASFTVDGGVLHATAVIGRDAGGTGEMLVTQDSAFNIIGQDPRLFVGRNGTATLQILDASTVHIEGLPTGTDSGVQI